MPFNSATLERYPDQTIHSGHTNMVKFSERHSNYMVLIQLKRWTREIKLELGSICM